MDWTIDQPDNQVVRVKVEIPTTTKGWEFWVLLRSDAHHDNPACNRSLEKKHLEQVKERKGIWIDNGDLFCAMQGKQDKRSSKSALDMIHKGSNYLDLLVEEAAEFYAPYAQNCALIGQGNHESSILSRYETDITERLCQTLHTKTGHKVINGGYTTWVKFDFQCHNKRGSALLWRMHGYGGGGPVTMDMIQKNRQESYAGQADIMFSGHTHDQWTANNPVLYVSPNGHLSQRKRTYIKCPTYKDEYKDGRGGWHVETGKPPKIVGAYWLRFYVPTSATDKRSEKNKRTKRLIDWQVIEAEQ